MKRLLISGGNGRFAREIIKQNTQYEIYAPSKTEMDITSIDSIQRGIYNFQPDIFLHLAALSRPMIRHTENPDISIQTNIIGTANVVLSCIKNKTKLVYASTDYVYPGDSGNYTETDSLLPVILMLGLNWVVNVL